ncbi:OmpA/MotB domain protein [Thalassoporum mexicanum PCC 7367]|uniref:OmpA family protein n=1 Tax=Thalassoporum mexicanum TaxID=3457544 RepID=UPI00029FFE21|nr:OmpA family protein [Pseudanabaena sp. PCC 7367]AFY69348.1 OmpA/MotB domain protein [Pseudanabaena sp. PCC 7367]
MSDQPSANPEPELPPTPAPSPPSSYSGNIDNPPPPPPKESGSLLGSIFAFFFRLIVLGVGMSIATVVGISLAIVKPDLVPPIKLGRLMRQEDQKFTLAADVLFEGDRADLDPASHQILDQVAAELPLEPGKKISILGHMDNDGQALESDSLELSYQRAVAVRDYLSRLRGTETYYWIALGYGGSQPIEVNNSAENRRKNRRIEIVVSEP